MQQSTKMAKTTKQIDLAVVFAAEDAEKFITEERTNDKKGTEAMLLLKS